MKRFYTEIGTRGEGSGWVVLLDGRPVRTPARALLAVPAEALAVDIGQEWRAQGEEIDPGSMRFTRLATTVVDLMPARRPDAIAEAAGYAGTDLLCYRAEHPAELVARQARAWQPWLDWAERQYDARLTVAAGIMPVTQPDAALRALQVAVERLDDWRLVGLHAVTTLLGSLILGLALERGAADAATLFATALLDELFEVEQWGEDPGQLLRHARIRADLAAAERFLAVLRG